MEPGLVSLSILWALHLPQRMESSNGKHPSPPNLELRSFPQSYWSITMNARDDDVVECHRAGGNCTDDNDDRGDDDDEFTHLTPVALQVIVPVEHHHPFGLSLTLDGYNHLSTTSAPGGILSEQRNSDESVNVVIIITILLLLLLTY